MKKYSSNYCSVGNNYIININKKTNKIKNENLYSTYCVIQNILQRGNPTRPSKFLRESIDGYFVNERIKYASLKKQDWSVSIKGNDENSDNPARIFFEEILPKELKGNSFICNLIVPEIEVNEIVGEDNNEFRGNSVDFYLPQCKLVIEIDGAQHNKIIDKLVDNERDIYLKKYDVTTLRIPAKSIKSYVKGNELELREYIKLIYDLCQVSENITKYKESIKNLKNNGIEGANLIYDGIMRFQILVIELLKGGILDIKNEKWVFNIKNHDVKLPYLLAIKDIFNWLNNLLILQDIKLKEPKIVIKLTDKFTFNKSEINVDFSLFKRWDDSSFEDNICFIRSEYLDYINNYRVATGELIRYKIIQDGPNQNIKYLYNINEDIFGFKTFNDGQLPIIINALTLNETIGLLPTGGGKSLCYQLSCLLQPTINFAVVPIKSLMYDQKLNLDKKGIVQTNFISSDQEGEEKEKIIRDFARGKYLCIWISPERFQTEIFREQLKSINESLNVGYAVIDEVHCLSEWGHDFRTSYLNLSKTIRRLCPTSIFLGLTATASKNVLRDILVEFEMDESSVKTILDYTRNELEFKVIQDNNNDKGEKKANLLELLNSLDNKEKIFELNDEESKCGLIFTPHASGEYGCYGVSSYLNSNEKYLGKVKYYSGEVPKVKKVPVMDSKEFNIYKKEVQDKFQKNEFPLLIATKAFGMGVDKGNIRYTVHYGVSGSIESFYQEAGRAGRDKNKATCYILHSKDVIDEEDYNKIFGLETTIKELNHIVNKYKYSSGDILRNLFLATQSRSGVEVECMLTTAIYQEYCLKRKTVIDVNSVNKLGIFSEDERVLCNFQTIQSAIYRLSILGVIEDWTVEGWGTRGKFKVYYGDLNEKKIEESLRKYIKKYDVEFSMDNLGTAKYSKYNEIYNSNRYNQVYKLINILIQWNYDNVFYSRRESQKNLVELCDNYWKNGEKAFKENLEIHFKITERSFVLDYLANNPYDFKSLFKELMEEGKIKSNDKLAALNITLKRFLESYRYNTALNYLSGILGLLLNSYDDLTKERFVSSFNTIIDMDEDIREFILKNTLFIGKKLDDNNRNSLGEVLSEIYTDNYRIYNELGDNISLNKILEEQLGKLVKIGGRLNG